MTDENPNEQPDEGQQPEGSKLRADLEYTREENKSLKAKLRRRTFSDVGVDPESWLGQKIWNDYSGPIDDPDALKGWMSDNDIDLGSVGGQQAPQRQVSADTEEAKVRQTVDNVTQMRSTSTQPEGNRISYDEWKQNQLVDPKGAQEAFERGLVDIPQHIREHIG